MELSENIIDRLKRNILRLVNLNKFLEAENVKLAAKCAAQEKTLEDNSAKIAELQAQVTQLLLKNSVVEVTGGVKGARQRINALLRDIDRCMALMNK